MPDAEDLTRLSAFAVVFAAVALWEFAAPRRSNAHARRRRWPNNLVVAALNVVLVRVLLPGSAVALAIVGTDHGWGLFNNWSLASWAAIAGSVVLLDLAIYLQHVILHAVPALWRLHRVHHSDLDFDVTTGVRFHPGEILLSMLIKFTAVAALGAPAAAVLIFEVLLNATSMFNHGNVRFPARVDRYVRWIFVTPEMHRVHHSIVIEETNSNFGFSLSWWDRLRGTYRDQPAAGHERMTIGIDQFRDPRELSIGMMLTQPLRGRTGPYGLTSGGKG